MKSSMAVKSLYHALLTMLYVAAVVLIIFNLSNIVGERESLWFPILGLTLFVFSAAVCAALVFGRPVMLYLDGKKGEAVRFFGYTLGWIFVLLAIALLVMLVVL